MPVVLRGKHTLIIALTGSGKTEAAVIPIFTSLAENRAQRKGTRSSTSLLFVH